MHITEILKHIEEAKVDSKCFKQFEDTLFGEFNNFYKKKDKEYNTPEEDKIFDKIIDFVRGETIGKEKDTTLINALKKLKKCQESYPEILEPKKLKLYRGIGIDVDDFKKIKFLNKTKVNKFKDTSGIQEKYRSNLFRLGKYKYKGRSKVQSWTPKFENALKFAGDNINKIGIILEYTFPDKSLLFNTKFMNTISEKVGYGKENEIIRIENKPIEAKVYVFDNEDYERLIDDSKEGKPKPKVKPISKSKAKVDNLIKKEIEILDKAKKSKDSKEINKIEKVLSDIGVANLNIDFDGLTSYVDVDSNDFDRSDIVKLMKHKGFDGILLKSGKLRLAFQAPKTSKSKSKLKSKSKGKELPDWFKNLDPERQKELSKKALKL